MKKYELFMITCLFVIVAVKSAYADSTPMIRTTPIVHNLPSVLPAATSSLGVSDLLKADSPE